MLHQVSRKFPALRKTYCTAYRLSEKTKTPKICPFHEDIFTRHDDIIDVRTAAEFHDDHIPGAINIPVLDESERATVGKLHSKDAFEGHKIGASLISTNIGRIIKEHFINKPPDYSPLLYCWRGGLRSHSLALVLANIGYDVTVLEGGHKLYRKKVIEDLASLPEQLKLVIISGVTGSGKTKILQTLSNSGEQIVDLEGLARHKGSVLGRIPGVEQPRQKLFESLIWDALRKCDPSSLVWVESESRRVGNRNLPDELFTAMTSAPRVDLEVNMQERIKHIIDEYPYCIENPEDLKVSLSVLNNFKRVSKDRLDSWLRLVDTGSWQELVESLLVHHYDPTYHNSQAKNSQLCRDRRTVKVESLNEERLITDLIPKLLKLKTELYR